MPTDVLSEERLRELIEDLLRVGMEWSRARGAYVLDDEGAAIILNRVHREAAAAAFREAATFVSGFHDATRSEVIAEHLRARADELEPTIPPR